MATIAQYCQLHTHITHLTAHKFSHFVFKPYPVRTINFFVLSYFHGVEFLMPSYVDLNSRSMNAYFIS